MIKGASCVDGLAGIVGQRMEKVANPVLAPLFGAVIGAGRAAATAAPRFLSMAGTGIQQGLNHLGGKISGLASKAPGAAGAAAQTVGAAAPAASMGSRAMSFGKKMLGYVPGAKQFATGLKDVGTAAIGKRNGNIGTMHPTDAQNMFNSGMANVAKGGAKLLGTGWLASKAFGGSDQQQMQPYFDRSTGQYVQPYA